MSLTRIEQAFNDRFSRIPVVIPHKAFQGKAPGTIYFKGWTFHYSFHKHHGKDCLIVFESHPIAWASLHRVEINGTFVKLGDERQIIKDGESLEAFQARAQPFWDMARSYGIPV